MAHGTCSICGKEGRLVRGWCTMHYQRWKAHGDPLWEPVRRDPSQYDSSGHRVYSKVCPGCGGTFMLRSDQTHCSIKCALSGKPHPNPHLDGDRNPNWRGGDVGYWGMHNRVYKARGKADHCERCGATDPVLNYDWASLIDEPRDENDFAPMCRSCHRKFDNERDRQRPEWQGPAKRKLTPDTVREARALRASGATYEEIAARCGVSDVAISNAVRGITWSWVK